MKISSYTYSKLSENFNSFKSLKYLIVFEGVQLVTIIILSKFIIKICNIIIKNVLNLYTDIVLIILCYYK